VFRQAKRSASGKLDVDGSGTVAGTLIHNQNFETLPLLRSLERRHATVQCLAGIMGNDERGN
jgi:hypothetical protein